MRFWHLLPKSKHEWMNHKHIVGIFSIWVRSRNCGRLVTWFCYQLIAKPGNKTATVSWPDPYTYWLGYLVVVVIFIGFYNMSSTKPQPTQQHEFIQTTTKHNEVPTEHLILECVLCKPCWLADGIANILSHMPFKIHLLNCFPDIYLVNLKGDKLINKIRNWSENRKYLKKGLCSLTFNSFIFGRTK